MGNQSSSKATDYGGIYVKMADQVLMTGAAVNGTIYINLTKDYPGEKLCLTITGNEYTKWVENEKKGKNNYQSGKVMRFADNVLINKEIEIQNWKKREYVPKGQYTFPFQFVFPKGFPSSFYFRRGTAVAQIKYFITVYLKSDKKGIPKILYQIPVLVRETPDASVESKEISASKTLKTCCCIHHGTVSMRTAFEKNAYAPGSEARVITEIDNSKNSLPVSTIKYKLTQKVVLFAEGHKKVFNFTIKTVELGKVDPGESKKGSTKLEASITLPPCQEAGTSDIERIHLMQEYNPDPSSLITPSAHGINIQSNIKLEVVSDIKTCLFCESKPTNSLPIFVYSANLQTEPEPQIPQDWQPQQMPVTNFSVPVVQPVMVINQAPVQAGPGMVTTQMPHQPIQSTMMYQSQVSMQPIMTQPSLTPVIIQPMNQSSPGPVMVQSMNQSSPGPVMAQSMGQPSPHMSPVMVQPSPNMSPVMVQPALQGYQQFNFQTLQHPQYVVQPYVLSQPQVMQPQLVQVVNPYPNYR